MLTLGAPGKGYTGTVVYFCHFSINLKLFQNKKLEKSLMGFKSFWDVPKLSEKYISGICGYQGVGPVTWLLSVQSTSRSQGLNIVGWGREEEHMIAPCERFMLPSLSGDRALPGRCTLILASPWGGASEVSRCRGFH